MTCQSSGWLKSDVEMSVMQDFANRLLLEKADVTQIGEATIRGGLPFSFVFRGRNSEFLIPDWKRTETHSDFDDRRVHTIDWTDPISKLVVTCEATIFTEFPAVEWVLRFTNAGAADSPILEDIRALNLDISVEGAAPVTLHHSNGSLCDGTDFLPVDEAVHPNGCITLSPQEGRSSFPHLPFFNLALPGGGLVGAIGWSGQWEMSLRRNEGPEISLLAGQQTTHMTLHPGETIRTPRMLIVGWLGDDRMRGHNLLRRLLIDHYVPKSEGKPVTVPMTQNTWFAFNTGNDVTEENQLEIMKTMPERGIEAFWIDAGWFEGGWPNGVGSWTPKTDAFPRGLKPLGDMAHQLRMKFVVWFEPERVHRDSQIGREHPEWVLHHPGENDWGTLFDLGNPEARGWMTDHLSQFIGDWGIDVFRNDFNIGPLDFWKHADVPDRQGISEIRYIEGLYEMWDELLRRHPGLMIDNCASGGRRIDLETCSRSIPLWRSDTQCGYNAMPAMDQGQTAGLSLYVPLHAAGAWGFDPYAFRSVATQGTSICPDTRQSDFPEDQAKRSIDEMKSLRPYWLGDYYPLTPINSDDAHWCAWQFDRPDLGAGFAMIFRRRNSPYPAIDLSLRGLDSESSYDVKFVDSQQSRTMTGLELASLRLELESAPSTMLIKYARSKD